MIEPELKFRAVWFHILALTTVYQNYGRAQITIFPEWANTSKTQTLAVQRHENHKFWNQIDVDVTCDSVNLL